MKKLRASRWRCYARRIMLHIVARPRSPALTPFIASFHYHESDFGAAIERILPSGQAHLMVNLDEDQFRTYSGPDCKTVYALKGAVLAGPHGRFTAIDTIEQRRLVAVEFKLGGAAAFLRMPLSEACNQAVEMRDLWDQDGALLRERLLYAPTPTSKFHVLEGVLLEHLVRPPDSAITTAMNLMDRGESLSAARTRVGLLPKSFVRRFREQVGLTPKRFSRVRRLQRILGVVQNAYGVDWCRIAADHRYSDQAHLIHDFRDLAGISPTAYRPASPKRRNHVPLITTAR